MNIENCLKNVDDILSLYEEFGSNDYIGEDITQSEHAIQAALLAKEEGYDDETIIGALLHDIGHLIGTKFNLEKMENLGCLFHERLGSEVLKQIGLSEKICLLVNEHVQAKRYLVSKNKEYYQSLSEASKGTLIYQGGKMTEEEVIAFEENPNKELILKMRSWDDMAKIKGMVIPPLNYFKELIHKCII